LCGRPTLRIKERMMLKIIHWEKGWWDFSGDQLLKAAAKDLLGFDIEHFIWI
jgi:hypothetical protein